MPGITNYDNIKRYNGERKDIFKKVSEVPPPVITDPKSVTETNTKYKNFQGQFIDKCAFVTREVDVLLHALGAKCDGNFEEVKKIVDQADIDVPLDPRMRKRIEELEAKQRAREEAELAKAKKDGQAGPEEVPGQLKLKISDDGTEAEAASECTTTALDQNSAYKLALEDGEWSDQNVQAIVDASLSELTIEEVEAVRLDHDIEHPNDLKKLAEMLLKKIWDKKKAAEEDPKSDAPSATPADPADTPSAPGATTTSQTTAPNASEDADGEEGDDDSDDSEEELEDEEYGDG